jgi:predicted SAM-dependent methyltransferase
MDSPIKNLEPGSDRRIRLHLGSGSAIIPDFINVDMLSMPGVALRCDLSKTLPFKDESAHECYLCHVLEHFATNQVPKTLKELSRIMKPGAILRVCVPDLDIIFKTYVNKIEWFSPPHNPWLGLIYGGQKDEFDFHRTGFNYRWIEYLLEEAGFANIERYDPEEIHGIRDASFAEEPFGVNVSLNVRAIRV